MPPRDRCATCREPFCCTCRPPKTKTYLIGSRSGNMFNYYHVTALGPENAVARHKETYGTYRQIDAIYELVATVANIERITYV